MASMRRKRRSNFALAWRMAKYGNSISNQDFRFTQGAASGGKIGLIEEYRRMLQRSRKAIAVNE